ncbi:hypothetical protein ACVIGA_007530 [Bradyrhizobium sp. USDA 3240]
MQITESGLSLWRSLEASRAEQELIAQQLRKRHAEGLRAIVADTTDAPGNAALDRSDDIDPELPRLTDEDRADQTLKPFDRCA